MSLFSEIQSWFGSFQVKKGADKVHVQRKTIPFANAKKIGFLYDATADSNFETMKHYLKNIRSQQKEVHALGFVNHKNLPANKFPLLGLDFFCKKDLNWK